MTEGRELRAERERFEPRLLEIDLAALRADPARRVRPSPWRPQRRELERMAQAGGGALGLAYVIAREHVSPSSPAPLVVSVGRCVVRGSPTAARASIASRAPLTGLFAEGLVGGDFARRLASVADALALDVSDASDAAPGELLGEVLVVDADGSARLERMGELAGLSAARAHAMLAERWPGGASLAIGPAGERGVAFANLAASGAPPHFVGRGGLGAVLGRSGLKAVHVLAPLVESRADAEIARALLASPRLAARSRGGTFEQFEALSASGDLRSRANVEPVGRDVAARLAHEVERSKSSAHGCRGCPTPCGWVFETGARGEQGARFGASHALGLNLGLERFDDALALLATCDELGVDAKEAGAALALLARAAERGLHADAPRFGDRDAFERLLRECARDSRDELASLLRLGARAVAVRFGLESEHASAKGASLRPDENLASLLGQCVTSRGGDPMRVFPFSSFEPAIAREWCARGGFELDERAGDPRSPHGVGALVAWHEDWSNALDALGFCSFSAAGLLGDGVLSLDELERSIAPDLVAREGAGALLALGAELSLAQRALNERWGAQADDERPAWARAALDQPGVLPEYVAVRAAQRRGRRRRLEAARGVEVRAPRGSEERPERSERGVVTVRAVGAASEHLKGEVELELELPCTAREVLEELARRFPAASPALLSGGRPTAAVFRGGRAVGSEAWVSHGDVLDVVTIVSGG